MFLSNAEISATQHDAVLQRTRANSGKTHAMVESYLRNPASGLPSCWVDGRV
jgi:hypothetical protein